MILRLGAARTILRLASRSSAARRTATSRTPRRTTAARALCSQAASTSTSTTVSRGQAFQNSLPALAPNYKRLFILRHGQTDWNKQGLMQGGGFDIELNANGRDQAHKVANELSHTGPMDLVVSSHLSRASETADFLHAKHPAAKRIINASFGEMRFGDFEGASIHGTNKDKEMHDRFWSVNHKIRKDTSMCFPGPDGESTDNVEARTRSAVERLLEEHEDALHIAIVGHGRASQVLLASLLWQDAARYSDIEQGNTCINVIDVDYSKEQQSFDPVLLNYLEHTQEV